MSFVVTDGQLINRSDDCLRSVFMPLHVAIDSVYSRFYDYVHV